MRPTVAWSQLSVFLIIHTDILIISDWSFYEQHCPFLVTMATFLRLKLSCGSIIAANTVRLWSTRNNTVRVPIFLPPKIFQNNRRTKLTKNYIPWWFCSNVRALSAYLVCTTSYFVLICDVIVLSTALKPLIHRRSHLLPLLTLL